MDTLLKYSHELVMFLAVAVSMGGTTLLFRLIKTDNVPAIKATFALFKPTARAIGPVYGVGTILGLITGWVMGLNLLAFWLVASYAITIVAAVLGEVTKGWALRVAVLAEADPGPTPGPELKAALAEKAPRMIRMFDMTILLVIVALMVFRPNLW